MGADILRRGGGPLEGAGQGEGGVPLAGQAGQILPRQLIQRRGEALLEAEVGLLQGGLGDGEGVVFLCAAVQSLAAALLGGGQLRRVAHGLLLPQGLVQGLGGLLQGGFCGGQTLGGLLGGDGGGG